MIKKVGSGPTKDTPDILDDWTRNRINLNELSEGVLENVASRLNELVADILADGKVEPHEILKFMEVAGINVTGDNYKEVEGFLNEKLKDKMLGLEKGSKDEVEVKEELADIIESLGKVVKGTENQERIGTIVNFMRKSAGTRSI